MASSTTSNETSSTVPGPNYKWRVVAMLWFIAFFNYADRQAIFSVFPLLEKEMGLDSFYDANILRRSSLSCRRKRAGPRRD